MVLADHHVWRTFVVASFQRLGELWAKPEIWQNRMKSTRDARNDSFVTRVIPAACEQHSRVRLCRNLEGNHCEEH